MDWNLVLYILVIIAFVIASFYIPGLRGIWKLVIQAALSEAVLKRLFLMIAEKLVASTKNKLDDIWLKELKRKMGIQEAKNTRGK
ncbi:MAG: hypothetical protein H0Z28_11190 [Archaeoglobus sp.]|nr:hypothetical protein [Archaeoglobus sp.]